MINARLPYTAALALGLSACAPSGGEDGDTPGVPPGFELAMAKHDSVSAAQADGRGSPSD